MVTPNARAEKPQPAAVAASVAEHIGSLLPGSWSLRQIAATPGEDARFLLRAPGSEATILMEVSSNVRVREVADIATSRSPVSETEEIRMVVAPYLPPTVRAQLKDFGLSFADATGNLRLTTTSPPAFIFERGADADPWRGPGRPRGTLKGEPAARVVRALLDLHGPWRIRDLVQVSGASTGATYRVVEFLEAEGLVRRGDDKRIDLLDRSALIRRWSVDYQFLHTNSVTRWLAPRGLDALFLSLVDVDRDDYAVTGSTAAAFWAPYAPARAAMIYVEDPQKAAADWGLRATESGTNVLLAVPRYRVALERSTRREDGLVLAARAQVIVDLLTGPGRAPSEAEALIEHMETEGDADGD